MRGVGRRANSPISWVRIHGSFDNILDREPGIKSICRAENADTAWARLEESETGWWASDIRLSIRPAGEQSQLGARASAASMRPLLGPDMC